VIPSGFISWQLSFERVQWRLPSLNQAFSFPAAAGRAIHCHRAANAMAQGDKPVEL
jgi:hypothetical protein